MTTPQQWECDLYSRVVLTLEEGHKTDSSYYALVKECIRLCEEHEIVQPDD
jgi:hypothetical protein